jgi:hypothetical protein
LPYCPVWEQEFAELLIEVCFLRGRLRLVAALVGKTLPAPGGNPRANFKPVPLPEISACIALLCEEGHASGSSLDAHFRKL